MPPFTPQLQLETLFLLDGDGRILSTRDPHPEPGPAFSLIRDARACAWAVNVDVPSDLTRELVALARTESPARAITDPPHHADAYVALLGSRIDSGPVFTFPPTLVDTGDVVPITAFSQLERHLRGWTADEIPERAPILGIAVDGHAVSVCFCARRSEIAAEAGVTAAWARLIRIRDACLCTARPGAMPRPWRSRASSGCPPAPVTGTSIGDCALCGPRP